MISRHIFYFIAMALTCHAKKPADCSELFSPKNFTSPPSGLFSFCPGITVVINTDGPAQLLPNTGIGFNYAFWVDGMRDKTIQCFPKRGYKYTEEVSDEGITTISSSGHYAKIFLGPDETTGVNFFNDWYVFSGPNPNNITAPGLYYMDGGSYSYIKTPDNDGSGFSTIDYTRIVGNFIDLCAKFEVLIDGSNDDEDVTSCVILDKKECKKNNKCKWAGGNGCISMPWD